MNPAMKNTVRVWCTGLILFALRLYQNLFDFDGETGLAAPSLAGTALVGAVAAAAVWELVLGRRLSRECPLFNLHFAAPEKSMPVLVVGSLFLAVGGALMGYGAVADRPDIAALVTAALAIVSCAGFLVLTRQLRGARADSVTPVLPVMFFSAFWVLALYLPAGSDPVFARYYFPILAAAACACAFAQLAGFFRAESRVRSFTVISNLAAMLCIAAVAEPGPANRLIFLGCALILSVFTALQKQDSQTT